MIAQLVGYRTEVGEDVTHGVGDGIRQLCHPFDQALGIGARLGGELDQCRGVISPNRFSLAIFIAARLSPC